MKYITPKNIKYYLVNLKIVKKKQYNLILVFHGKLQFFVSQKYLHKSGLF